MIELQYVRSLLFLPASNPRAITRARQSAADLVVLDLEDAVKPAEKALAREATIEALAEPWPMPVAIRVNGVGSEWHQDDVVAVAGSRSDLAVLPRASSAAATGAVRDRLGKPLLAMIETSAGVLAAADIAGEVYGLVAGTNDLAADLRLPQGAGRGSMQAALQLIVLAARSSQIAVFDGVFNSLIDAEGFAAEAAEGRLLGFDGKSLIHPDQIDPCHRAFAPSEQEIDRARRLIAASSGGAERFEDQMIERMHVEAARRLLERAAS